MPEFDGKRPAFLNTVWRYVVALATALLAIALRVWLNPLLGDRNRYHTAWAAIAFCAWYCGVGPSVLATVVSAFGVWFWFFTADRPDLALYRMELWGTVGFLLFSAVIIAFGEAARRSRARSERVEESLRESEAQLKLANQNMQEDIERRTTELERKTTQTLEQAKLLDLANDAIFVRSADDRISYWNLGAERLYGWTKKEAIGCLSHDLLRTVFPVPLIEIAKFDRWEGELTHSKRDGSSITVASRWTTLRDHDGTFGGWLEINTDITARKRLEDAARRLTGRILSLQDDERRRIARELHDSLGQYLASIKINLDLLARTSHDPDQILMIQDCLSSAEECLAETRTISHLLHPPLLDEAGFVSAARWYVEGFGQRSPFQVELDFPPTVARLDRDVETALFRILQESLTNVHRHSNASAVRVSLKADAQRILLEITDNGQGISEEQLNRLQTEGSASGVGLVGMRERMRDLGGQLQVVPANPGTTVIASIPMLRHLTKPLADSNRGVSAA